MFIIAVSIYVILFQAELIKHQRSHNKYKSMHDTTRFLVELSYSGDGLLDPGTFVVFVAPNLFAVLVLSRDVFFVQMSGMCLNAPCTGSCRTVESVK